MAPAYEYVLFTHYGYKDTSEASKLLNVNRRRLGHVLNDTRGLLLVFWDVGWQDLLNVAGDQLDPKRMADNIQQAERARLDFSRALVEVGPSGDEEPSVGRLADRVRFVTGGALFQLLGNLRGEGAEATRLVRYFVGQYGSTRYDAPKVIEAMIRIRLLGSGIPVLRIDWDALFAPLEAEDPEVRMRQLLDAVSASCRAYQARRIDSRIYSFMFSGAYQPRAEYGTLKWWLQAYATRPIPAFLVNPTSLVDCWGKVDFDSPREGFDPNKLMNEDLLFRFYGLSKDFDGSGIPSKIESRKATGVERLLLRGRSTAVGHALEPFTDSSFPIEVPSDGLSLVGANPLSAVISGALLCLSDSAILDLPPFSNFRENVSWIDDHLKYALHRELRHFPRGALVDDPDPTIKARIDDVHVEKTRPILNDLPIFALGAYIPTVLWGMVVDAWIQPEPVTKVAQSMPRDAPKVRKDLMLRPGVLAQALHDVMQKHRLDDATRSRLRSRLRVVALKRISEVYRLWSKLRTEQEDSFASAWVTSRAKELVRQVLEQERERLSQAGSDAKKVDQATQKLEKELTGLARGLLATDVDDAADELNAAIEACRGTEVGEDARKFADRVQSARDSGCELPIEVDFAEQFKPQRAEEQRNTINQAQERVKAGGVFELNELAPAVREKLETLVEDALIYLDWTTEWPKFVQAIRSIPRGTLRIDLDWNGFGERPWQFEGRVYPEPDGAGCRVEYAVIRASGRGEPDLPTSIRDSFLHLQGDPGLPAGGGAYRHGRFLPLVDDLNAALDQQRGAPDPASRAALGVVGGIRIRGKLLGFDS